MKYNRLFEDSDVTKVKKGKGTGDTITYSNVPDPNNPERILPYDVTIVVEKAQEYVQNAIAQLCLTYPSFNDYLGGGNRAMNVYIVDHPRIQTMATDRKNIYVSPYFVWKMAHQTNLPIWSDWGDLEDLSDEEKASEWPRFDVGTWFVLMHEVYHCLLLHHARETKFKAKHPEITDFDHQKANYVQDQEINAALEANCLFDQYADENGNQAGVVKLIGGVLLELDGTEGWNKIDKVTFDKIYNGPYKVDIENNGDSIREMFGYDVMRKYPTNFCGTWEDLYLYFEEHGWPNFNQKKEEEPPHGPGREKEQPTDQEIYDAGYYDGYYHNPFDNQLRNNPDYQMGLEDGEEYRKIDDEYHTNINSPEYMQGVEDAKNGNVSEQRVFVDINDYRIGNFNAIFEAFQTAKNRGFLCEWRKIDRTSQAYRDGVASVTGKTSNPQNNNQNNQNGQNDDSEQNPQRRGQDNQNQQEDSNGERRGGDNSQDGQNQDGQGGNRRGQKPGQNQEGNGEGDGQGQSEGGKQEGNGGQKRPARRRKPKYPPGRIIVEPPMGPGGNNGNGPEPDEKFPPKDPKPGLDDQLTQEEGLDVMKKIFGEKVDPSMEDPDKKWKDNALNGKDPLGPISIDPKDLPQSVRNQSGNGWGPIGNSIREKIIDALVSSVNWQEMLLGYMRNAFKAQRERIGRKWGSEKEGYAREFAYHEEVDGGESIGNIAFALDQSGSMWSQTSSRESSGGVPDAMKKFFTEIAKIRENIGKPIKGIATFSFASNEPYYLADYFEDGCVANDWNPIDKSGGTSFENVFHLMKKGKVYEKKSKNRIWTDFDDKDFPIVTVVCTDGEDDVPALKKNGSVKNPDLWDPDEKLIIWFVINNSPNYILTFKEKLRKGGYNPQYYIGITTDQIYSNSNY